MTLHRAALAFSLFTAITLPSVALADNEPPIVALLLKTMEQQMKVRPSYEAIETAADGTITITGLSANVPVEGAPGSAMKMTIGEIELEEVSDEGNGLWEIGGATYSDFKLDFAGPENVAFTVDIPEMSLEDWYVREPGNAPSAIDVVRANMSTARKASSGKITVVTGGQTYSAESSEMTWDGDPATGSGKTSAKVVNIVIPEAAIAMLDTSGQLKALGYNGLALDLGGDVNMTFATDKLSFDFDVFATSRGMGTFRIGGAAADIPEAVLAELQKEGNQQPDFAKIMPQLMGIQLSRASVRFEDASITAKLIPLAAQMQGMDAQTLVANTGAMVQLGLAELKNPAFTQKAVEAVSAFLKDPKSITISAKPATSVSVQQMMAIDPANPGAAIDTLGVTITAND